MKPFQIANQWEEDENLPENGGIMKVFVLAELARLVEEGGAAMATLEAGTHELRLATGEIFHLGAETITRIA